MDGIIRHFRDRHRNGAVIIILVTAAFGLMSCSVRTCDRTDNDQNIRLVEKLRYPPIEGAWEGYATGITTNAATEAVCAKGAEIIPALISALDHSSWKQTVWIVVCLTELRAIEAKPRILELKSEYEHGRFAKEPHDLTLDLQIEFYLEAVKEGVEPREPGRSDRIKA